MPPGLRILVPPPMLRADMLPPMLRVLIPLPPLNPFWSASRVRQRPTVVVKAIAAAANFFIVFLITAPDPHF
jgi:hypothetical protein